LLGFLRDKVGDYTSIQIKRDGRHTGIRTQSSKAIGHHGSSWGERVDELKTSRTGIVDESETTR
jgi:hypothetical protein